jgi:hypothetical protein
MIEIKNQAHIEFSALLGLNINLNVKGFQKRKEMPIPAREKQSSGSRFHVRVFMC